MGDMGGLLGGAVDTGRPVERLMVTDLGVCDWGPTAGYGKRWLVSLPGGYELNG